MFTIRRSLLSAIRSRNPLISREQGKHTLPQLPYEYNALQPVICGEIMNLHHAKHHATYVNNLNAAEDKLQKAIADNDVATIIALGPALKFNGGGHINHSIFWQVLSPCGGQPSNELMCAITNDFGGLDRLKEQLSALAVGVQGSGWAWLAINPKSKRLQLAACANQDPLESTTGLVPLFGIDVWEHAYYLQYKNVRADYVKNIFDIVNWQEVSRRFSEVTCK